MRWPYQNNIRLYGHFLCSFWIERRLRKYEGELSLLPRKDLKSTQKELDAALAYHDELKPSCLDLSLGYTGTCGVCTSIPVTRHLEGPFLAVSKLNFATEGSFCRTFLELIILRNLQNWTDMFKISIREMYVLLIGIPVFAIPAYRYEKYRYPQEKVWTRA